MKRLLLALFAFGSVYMSGCNSTASGDPKTVLTAFFDAMAKKDIPAARKLATASSKEMFDLMEMGMKQMDTRMEENVKEKYDKGKMEIGEAKIEGDKATVNVKETKSGKSINFILRNEGGWKVAMDMNSMMEMGAEKLKDEGMSAEDIQQMKTTVEKFKNMNADSVKMVIEKAKKTADSIMMKLNQK